MLVHPQLGVLEALTGDTSRCRKRSINNRPNLGWVDYPLPLHNPAVLHRAEFGNRGSHLI